MAGLSYYAIYRDSVVKVAGIAMPNFPAFLHLTAGVLSDNTKRKKKGCISKYFEGTDFTENLTETDIYSLL